MSTPDIQGSAASAAASEALDKLRSGDLQEVAESPFKQLVASVAALRSSVHEILGRSSTLAIAASLVVLALVAAALAQSRMDAPPIEASIPRAGRGPDGGDVAASPRAPVQASTTVAASIVVDVGGAVTKPGLVVLPAGARVHDAIAGAGGPAEDADLDRVNRAAPVADGDRLYVPHRGQREIPAVVAGVPGQPPGSSGAPGASAGSAEAQPVDLNAATAAQLEELPGVGPATAQAIVEYREAHGRFGSVDELLEVRGIGDAKLANIRAHVRV